MTKKVKKDKEKEVIKYDVKNEQIILSQMMRSTKDRRRYCRELTEHLFVGKRHKIIFKTLCLMDSKNLEYNEDTFDTIAVDSEYGGFEYLRDLEELFEENKNLDFHIKRLRTDSLKVNLRLKEVKQLNELLEDPHADEEKISNCISNVQNKIRFTYTPTVISKGEELKEEYYNVLRERQEVGLFVSTGFEELDEFLTEGLARSKVSVWAARPSMGKTTFMANMILRLRKLDKKVLVCPLEVGKTSFIDSIVSATTNIPVEMIIKKTKELTQIQKNLIVNATSEILDDENLHFVDDISLTINKFTSLLVSSNYDIAVLDLFDNLADVSFEPKIMSKQLKTIQSGAKLANVHIALVNQIRRDVEKARNKRPTLNTLKNSGSFEEIADLIGFLHREKYYNSNIERDILEVIIAKQRYGVRNKTVYYEFLGDKVKVGNNVTDYNPEVDLEVF